MVMFLHSGTLSNARILCGPRFEIEVPENNNGLQNISGLSDYVVGMLGSICVGGLFPCLYGDSIFTVLLGLVLHLLLKLYCIVKNSGGFLKEN